MISFGSVFIIIAVLLIGMLVVYLTYNLLQKVGFGITYVVNFLILLVGAVFVTKNCNLKTIGGAIILSFIIVYLQNWIYQQADTFEEYVKKIIILGICMAVVVFLFCFLFTITINSMQF